MQYISDVLLWTPTYGRAKAGRPARTYIQQLCEDTGCIPEDLPEAMNDREKWRERVRDIRATSTTWWWWWWLQYIVWDDWPTFMIPGSNEQLQQELEYTLLKSDCHSWSISKMQSGREDTLEVRNTIKFCFKLGKMPQKRMECFGLLLEHLTWIEHQFLSGIRDSRKAGCLWGMMRGVGRLRKSIHQTWLAKGLGLGLLRWGFKGVQEDIPWEEASTFQIGSVAFPPGQCTSPQLYPCHWLFDQDGHQDSFSPSLFSRPFSLWLLVIPLAGNLFNDPRIYIYIYIYIYENTPSHSHSHIFVCLSARTCLLVMNILDNVAERRVKNMAKSSKIELLKIMYS